MAASPWELLGIDPGASVAEIRRAYAVLLKRTRPDDDPEAFQRLLQARDAALAAVEPAGKGKGAPGLPNGTAPEDAVPLASEPASAEEPAQSADGERARPAPNRAAAPVALPPGGSGGGSAVSSLADIIERLKTLRVPFTAEKIAAWQSVVDDLATLDFGARRLAHDPVVLALEAFMVWVGSDSTRDPCSSTMRDLAGIAVALDQEFGWGDDSRPVHAALRDPGAAARFLRALVRLRFVHRLHAGGFPERQDSRGLPVVEKADLDSFFQKESAVHSAHLDRMRAAGRWLPSFDLVAAACGLFWALTKRLNAMFVGGLVLLGACLGADWLARHLGKAHLGTPLMALCALAVVHFVCGAYGRNARLWQMWEAVRRSDLDYLTDPADRAAFLREAGRPRRWPVMLLGILTLAGAGLSAANFAPLDTPAVPSGRVEQPAATPPRPPRAPLRVTVDATAVLLRANLLVIARTAENDAVRRANLQISRAEAWLLAAHLPDEYAAALRDVLAGPLDARLRDVVLTRLEHADRREPPGGFRACPEWDSPGGPTAADRQAEPRLKATLAAAEPSVLAVSEYAGVLRRARREPDLVAAMADVHDGLHGRRGRRGGYVLLYKVDRTINCALDALWRRPD